MYRALVSLVSAGVLFAASAAGQSSTSKTLDIYVIDVEGGNATLFVSPSRESLLIDSGNGGARRLFGTSTASWRPSRTRDSARLII